jgi:hypothetical protein
MGSTFSKKKIRPQEPASPPEPKTITECCNLIVQHGGDYIYKLPEHLLYITYNGGKLVINNQILTTAIKHNFDLSKNKFDPKLLIHHKFYNTIDPMELLIAKNIENIRYLKEKYDLHIFIEYFMFAIDNPDFNLTHMKLLDWDAKCNYFVYCCFHKIAEKLYNKFKNKNDSDEYFDLVPYKYKNKGMFERSVLKDIKNVSLAHRYNYDIIFAPLKLLSDEELVTIKLPYFDNPLDRMEFYSDCLLHCPKLIRCIPKEENLLDAFKHLFWQLRKILNSVKHDLKVDIDVKNSDIDFEVLFSVIPHEYFSDMKFFWVVIQYIYQSKKPEIWNYIPSSYKTTKILEKMIKFDLDIWDIIPQTLRPNTKDLCDFIIEKIINVKMQGNPKDFFALLQNFHHSLITDDQFYNLIEKNENYFRLIPKERLTKSFYENLFNFVLDQNKHQLFKNIYGKLQIAFQHDPLLIQRVKTHIDYVSLIQTTKNEIN